MRYGRFLTALTLPLAFAAVPAQAVDTISEGGFEFTLAGQGSSNEDVDAGSFSGEASIAALLGPNFSIGARQNITYNDANAGTVLNGSTRVFTDFQFNLGRVAPFVGANFGYVYGDTVNETFAIGPEAGLKIYLGETSDVFLFGRVEYQFFFDEGDAVGDVFEDGQLLYTIGLGLRF
jgi:hypothetical protein